MAHSMCKCKMPLLTKSANCVENIYNNTWKEISTGRYEFTPLFCKRRRFSYHTGVNLNYSVVCLIQGSARHLRDTLNEIPPTIALKKRLRHNIRNRYKTTKDIVPRKLTEPKQEEVSKPSVTLKTTDQCSPVYGTVTCLMQDNHCYCQQHNGAKTEDCGCLHSKLDPADLTKIDCVTESQNNYSIKKSRSLNLSPNKTKLFPSANVQEYVSTMVPAVRQRSHSQKNTFTSFQNITDSQKSEPSNQLSGRVEKPSNIIISGNILALLENASVTCQPGDDAFQVQTQDVKRSEEPVSLDSVSKLPEVSSLTSLLQQITDVLQDCEENSQTSISETEESCLDEITPLRVASEILEVHVVNSPGEEITPVQQRTTYFDAYTHEHDYLDQDANDCDIVSQMYTPSQITKVPSKTNVIINTTPQLMSTSHALQTQLNEFELKIQDRPSPMKPQTVDDPSIISLLGEVSEILGTNNDQILRANDQISYIQNDVVGISSNLCLTSQTPEVPSITSLLGDITAVLEDTSQKPQLQTALDDDTDWCEPFPERDSGSGDITRDAAILRSDISAAQDLTIRKETSSNTPDITDFNSQGSIYRASIRVSPYNFPAHLYRQIKAKSTDENQEAQIQAEKEPISSTVSSPTIDARQQKFLGNDFTSSGSAGTNTKCGHILSSHRSKKKRPENHNYNIDSQFIKKRKHETTKVKRRNSGLTQPECLTPRRISTHGDREELATTRHKHTANSRKDNPPDLLQTYLSNTDKLPTNLISNMTSAKRSVSGRINGQEQRRSCRHSVPMRISDSQSVYRWVKGKASQRHNIPQATLKRYLYTEEWVRSSKTSRSRSKYKWVKGQAAHSAETSQIGTQDNTCQQTHDKLVGDFVPKRKVIYTKGQELLCIMPHDKTSYRTASV